MAPSPDAAAPGLSKRRARFTAGVLALVLALGYLVLALRLPMGRLSQPGAAVFPVVVSALVALGGLATLLEALTMDAALRIDLPVGADFKRLAVLVAALAGYLVLLPVLGHVLTCTLFFVVLMRQLSSHGWLRVGLTSLALAIGLHLVFVRLLQVPMPTGAFGF